MRRKRTGCITCRIRKIKCDETKPNCQKCTSTGRTCDGYSVLPFSRTELHAASQRSQSPAKTDGTSGQSSSLIPRLVTDESFRTVAEKRYFQFFRNCTVASTNLTVDSRFWDSLVLQACDAEPAIKHTILTLASYHNSVIAKDDRDISRQHLAYSERQYQQALGEAKQLIETPSNKHIDRILMVCILFIVFEYLRGNYAAAQKHMDSGRTIAAQCRQAGQQDSRRNSPREIAEVFARLDVFVLSFSDATAPYQYTLDDLLRTAPELQPSRFTNIHEAHVSLIDLIRWMLVTGDQMAFNARPLDPALPYYEAQLLECEQRLSEWRQYWNELLPTLEQRDSLHAKVIELWYIKGTALLKAGFFGPETRYDVVSPHFEQMVLLSEDISREIRKTADISAFSLDLGYLAAVFFIAIRCRDPQLRRRAILVLESHPRREGMWESTAAAAIASRWMLAEEEGLGDILSADQVTESNRVAVLDLEVNSAASSARLRFTGSAAVAGAEPGVRYEDIRWTRSK